MQPIEEVWRPVAETGGQYEVSSTGRVRSWVSRWGPRTSPKVLKPTPAAHGYLQVCLPSGKKAVHRLVADAFIGPCPDGYEVAHNDGNNQNNAAVNLRYATHSGNLADRIQHGTDDRGERSALHILTAEKVAEIRRRYPLGGASHRSLALEFGVTKSQIGRIIRGESWAA